MDKVNSWISVGDAIPNRNMKVMWLCEDGVKDTGFFYKDKGEIFASFDLRSTKEITHWMPVPELQKK